MVELRIICAFAVRSYLFMCDSPEKLDDLWAAKRVRRGVYCCKYVRNDFCNDWIEIEKRFVSGIADTEFSILALGALSSTAKSGIVSWLFFAPLDKSCEGYGALLLFFRWFRRTRLNFGLFRLLTQLDTETSAAILSISRVYKLH